MDLWTDPRLRATADLCDALKDHPDFTLQVLPPVLRHFGRRRVFAGQVSTVRCFEDNSLVKQALQQMGVVAAAGQPPSRVLVVDGGASLRAALLGGGMAAAAQRSGWAGLLLDGCIRDVCELADIDLGVLALAANPFPIRHREEGERDVPVRIQGVRVTPGDWLVADDDGVVIVSGARGLHP
ncbi:MAG: ribonuclease E activity regulator RraA [Burkholderiaceae bacterium]